MYVHPALTSPLRYEPWFPQAQPPWPSGIVASDKSASDAYSTRHSQNVRARFPVIWARYASKVADSTMTVRSQGTDTPHGQQKWESQSQLPRGLSQCEVKDVFLGNTRHFNHNGLYGYCNDQRSLAPESFFCSLPKGCAGKPDNFCSVTAFLTVERKK